MGGWDDDLPVPQEVPLPIGRGHRLSTGRVLVLPLPPETKSPLEDMMKPGPLPPGARQSTTVINPQSREIVPVQPPAAELRPAGAQPLTAQGVVADHPGGHAVPAPRPRTRPGRPSHDPSAPRHQPRRDRHPAGKWIDGHLYEMDDATGQPMLRKVRCHKHAIPNDDDPRTFFPGEWS